MSARIKRMSHHAAAADAGAESHHQKARVVPTVAVEPFTQCGGGGVVFDRDRAIEPFGELAPDVHALEPGDVGEAPAATLAVHLARDRETDGIWFWRQREHDI